jgi:hypothetical protein
VKRGGAEAQGRPFDRLAQRHARCIPSLGRPLLLCALGSIAGCVLPGFLESVDDTEVNLQPVVIKTDPSIEQLTTLSGGVGNFFITVEDENLGDTLHARFFVDYPSAPQSGIAALIDIAPGPAVRPAAMVSIACGARIPSDGSPHTVTAVVADRAFIDDGLAPPYRHLPADALSVEVAWSVICP